MRKFMDNWSTILAGFTALPDILTLLQHWQHPGKINWPCPCEGAELQGTGPGCVWWSLNSKQLNGQYWHSAHRRHLANTTEPSVYRNSAALRQVTLTTCSYFKVGSSVIQQLNASLGLHLWRWQCFGRTLPVKAKFHYAILVADRSEAGRRPDSELDSEWYAKFQLAAGLRPGERNGIRLRTGLRPGSSFLNMSR